MIKYILYILATIRLFGGVYASDREQLLGVDIVSREERDADDSWRLATNHPTISPSVTPWKRTVRWNALQMYFSHDFVSDKSIRELNDESLHRPQSYTSSKRGIVIHHTASSQESIDRADSIEHHLRNLYQFHTYNRGRGDLGYHFLIDEEGVIYEGRAGGPDVIGAHMLWNNHTTIGVALIGNFQEKHPSDAMIGSLEDIVTALARSYAIDPSEYVFLHQETDESPYINQVYIPSILGHRDAGRTTCPGDHVYELLPSIRETVTRRLLSDSIGEVDDVVYDTPLQWWPDGSERMSIDVDTDRDWDELLCELVSASQRIAVRDCIYDGDSITVSFDRADNEYDYQPVMLSVADANQRVLYEISMVPEFRIQSMLIARQLPYTSSLPTNPAPIRRMIDPVSIEDARERLDEEMTVLLHDASLGEVFDFVSCEYTCVVDVDDDTREGDELLLIEREDDLLGVAVDGTNIGAFERLTIYDRDNGWVALDSYDRTSYAGIPRNRFAGSIDIYRDRLTNINTGLQQQEYIFVNRLLVSDYLLGMAETAVADPVEKHKVLALLIKSYISYYLSDEHAHPSVHPDAQYDAIDDPRAFQKYVGIGRLDVMPERESIVDETIDTWITYDDAIPLLPYFSCSAGFTWSAEDKRGWVDTPYLVSVVDFSSASCDEFAGHGVGLSGQGATYLAKQGLSATDILQYYYNGIVVSDSIQ